LPAERFGGAGSLRAGEGFKFAKCVLWRGILDYDDSNRNVTNDEVSFEHGNVFIHGAIKRILFQVKSDKVK
jgi:hypothetical protein